MMSKFVQFTGVHFTVNPNSQDLNNMNLDLNVSTKVKFSANDQGLQFKNQGKYRFLLRVLLCILYRALTCAFTEMKPFERELQLYRYFTYCDYSRIFKILPNVRSTINVKKGNTNLFGVSSRFLKENVTALITLLHMQLLLLPPYYQENLNLDQTQIKLTIFNVLGQANDILDLKMGFDKTLKNIPAISEDLLRIAWMCIKSR